MLYGLEGVRVDVEEMPADFLRGEPGGERCEQGGVGAAAGVEDAYALAGELLLEVADGVLDVAEEDGGTLAFEEAEGGSGGAESFAGGEGDAG